MNMVKSQVKTVYIPAMLQNPELPGGCESVSLTIALAHYGYKLPKTTIQKFYMPTGETNMATAFVGSPYKAPFGGCYAPAIVTAANKYLTSVKSKYKAYEITGTSLNDVCKYIDQGYPVIVWGTIDMTLPRFTGDKYSYGGGTYLRYTPEHCMVIYGYNKNTNLIYISDPLAGLVSRNKKQFENIYNITGKMAVVIK